MLSRSDESAQAKRTKRCTEFSAGVATLVPAYPSHLRPTGQTSGTWGVQPLPGKSLTAECSSI